VVVALHPDCEDEVALQADDCRVVAGTDDHALAIGWERAEVLRARPVRAVLAPEV